MYAPGRPKRTIRLPAVASATETFFGADGAGFAELGGLGQGGVRNAITDFDHDVAPWLAPHPTASSPRRATVEDARAHVVPRYLDANGQRPSSFAQGLLVWVPT